NVVRPAVVSIQAEEQAKRPQARRLPPGAPPGMEDFFRQFQMPDNTPRESSGSGFIVSKDGYILTNNHVVAGADRLMVTLLDRRVFPARVVGRDSTTDVAVIKIDANDLPTVQLGEDTTAHIGTWVLAIGNPLGLNFTVTAGIVSAKGRQLQGLLNPNGQNPYAIMDYIQTDAAINPGNSGGPLVNLKGQVVGINSAIASGTGYYAGYGFAIPITLARRVMEDLIQYGQVRRAVLGVSIGDVDASQAKIAGLKDIHGAVVQGFSDEDTSPAKRAGVELGDVIVAVDGHDVENVAGLQRMIRDYKPGQTVSIDVMRYGQKKTLQVKLGEPPNASQVASASNDDGSSDAATAGKASTRLGIDVAPLGSAVRDASNVPAEWRRGLLVTSVDPSGPARVDPSQPNSTGLAPNDDIIVREQYPKRADIRSTADLDAAVAGVKKGDVLQLLVYNMRAQNTRLVNIQVR
ncbi:MAG TPA: trypsin-like peptidase domain-containing protein, partial [Gemmatimonadaceae bacterium]|nr:trypsin-like peptidase domain-containing protein [Gemmatimonadaceae bacterium]